MFQFRVMLVAGVFLLLGFRVALSDDVAIETTLNTENTSLRVMPPLLGVSETNKKTLDILKTQLRRNNDDYEDKSGKGSKWEEKSPNELFKSNNRRILNDNSTTTCSSISPNTTIAKGKKRSNEAPTFRAESANGKAKKNHNAKKPVANRDKVNKLRSFLDKYKVIVNEFMTNRTESTVPSDHQAANTQSQKTAPRSAKVGRMSGVSKPEMRSGLLPPGLDHHPPIGYQLDMSPARGGRVHSLRGKNRLCHRHVMIPEGPKYDSKGRAYLAEFSPVKNREYDHTRKPKLLLPKCCNCCRKSVLGCQ